MKTRHHLGLMILCIAGSITANGLELGGIPGNLLLDGRLRYETADIDGLEESDALTYRLRFGVDTTLGEWITFLAEGEGTIDLLGDYDPYPGAQGEPGYAIIADPDNLELNRLQLSFDLDPVQAVLGRQRIIRNNARFIGNVGWRQNEQTFDAVAVDATPIEEVHLYYAYLDAAYRIFGDRADVAAQRKFEMEGHVIEAQLDIGETITMGVYGYLLGIDNAAANSSNTVGMWLAGSSDLTEDGLSINWRGEFADQMDNGHSPEGSEFNLGYYHITAGLAQKGSGGITLGYELLQGDGSRGFSTPLATLHAFNGFADAFLSTPSNGLVDMYIKIAIPLKEGISAAIFYHDFEEDRGGVSLGTEIDAVCSWKINGNLSATAKVAHFSGDTRADITRFWLQLDMKY